MQVTTRRSSYIGVRTRPAEPPRNTSILGKDFGGMKTNVQMKANSVPSDAAASIIRPLTSSDGDTGRPFQTRERHVDLIPTLRKLTARRYDCCLKDYQPRLLRPTCKSHLHFQEILERYSLLCELVQGRCEVQL